MELSEVIAAYFDCRRNKRNTANQLRFEMNYESECIKLWEDIESRSYEPRRSIAFVVEKPVKREIFAADFRDRVVHHIIARHLYPHMERQFHADSYATQKGKGTLYGIKRVERHLRDCSEWYTRDCYIMKTDIQGFFMSISKQRLYDSTMAFTRKHYSGQMLDDLEYLIRKTIFNRPEKNCILKVPRSRWEGLPANKSLFGTDGTRGLPIGNLTSQLMALLFLDPLDHLVTEQWGVKYYGRYVDDMVMIHPSREYLTEVREKMRSWLKARELTLHPKKMYLQHCSKGVLFVGGMIKPGRKYISRRTVRNLMQKIHTINEEMAQEGEIPQYRLMSIRSTVNSYFGTMRHYNAQGLMRHVMMHMDNGIYRHMTIQAEGRRYKIAIENDNAQQSGMT